MNLELLDPFGRQVPDRIDATLELNAALHFRSYEEKKGKSSHASSLTSAEPAEWKAAYHVAFNRRGLYVAVGYGSGTVAVHNLLSRTLTALYRNDDPTASPSTYNTSHNHTNAPDDDDDDASNKNNNMGLGISSVSWSRRSRTLLAGSAGDSIVRLFDNSHPYGADEANAALLLVETETDDATAGSNDHTNLATNLNKLGQQQQQQQDQPIVTHHIEQTLTTSFRDPDERFAYSKQSRTNLLPIVVRMGHALPHRRLRETDVPWTARGLDRYPAVAFDMGHFVGGSLQVNPCIPTAGLAVWDDTGSLVLFWQHPSVWVDVEGYETPQPIIVPIWETNSTGDATSTNRSSAGQSYSAITCAAFDPHGDRVYAATKDGWTMGFDVSEIWKVLTMPTTTSTSTSTTTTSPTIPTIEPVFNIAIPGAPSSWHLLVSRNGKFFVVNSADGALRLYSTKECWNAATTRGGDGGRVKEKKPTHVFQDVVTKVKFASCDLSGDGEYVVGGANGEDHKYELYIWNTSTGALMDKLTGPSVQLYSVAWHPVRSFVAVATSDGLVDIWGPRKNWTSFAPDFQALPMNVEYVECEDELDVDKNGKFLVADQGGEQQKSDDSENTTVDVCTVEPIPVFASDSEDETEVFVFEPKICNLMVGRRITKAVQLEE